MFYVTGTIFRHVNFFVHCMYCRLVVVICAIICIVLIISFMTYIYRKEGTSICIRKCSMFLFYIIQFFIFRWCIVLILFVCWLKKTTISLQSLLSVRLLKKHWFQSKDLKCNELDAEISSVKYDNQCKGLDFFCKLKYIGFFHCLYAMFICLREKEREKVRERKRKNIFLLTFFISYWHIKVLKGIHLHVQITVTYW